MDTIQQLLAYVSQGYVLHGSDTCLNVIEPRRANDYNDTVENNQLGVYATNDIRIAITFATIRLPKHKDAKATLRIWGSTFVTIEGHGVITTAGFVHVLPANAFTQIRDRDFLSRTPVSPVSVLTVDPSHWQLIKDFTVRLR